MMKFDLLELMNGKKNKIEVHTIIEKDSFYYDGEKMNFISPMDFKGTFRKNKDEYFLKGTCKVVLECVCSRCLEKFQLEIDLDVDEMFSKEPESEEIKKIDGNMVDIYEVIEENLFLNIPIQRLCKESCKGLCLSCGTNLNKTLCMCDTNKGDENLEEEVLDPRFAKLKSLFKS